MSIFHWLTSWVAVITPLPIQRKRWQSVLWPDEGDPVEKGGRRWAQASQRQEQKWEEVQVCHPLNRNTKDTIFFEICFAVRPETPRLTILLRLMLQCKVKELHTPRKDYEKRRHCLKYTHLTVYKLFTEAVIIILPWWNGGMANSGEVPATWT